MKLAYKFYLYWKYFFKFLPEDRHRFYWESISAMKWGTGLVLFCVGLCFVPFLWPMPDWLFNCLKYTTRAGEVIAYAGLLYWLFLCVKSVGRDIQQYLSRRRWAKIDKTRFYAAPVKSHIPLPAPVEIPIARIQLGKPKRSFIHPDWVQGMAHSLGQEGLQKPIKVRPLTPEEKAQDPEHDHKLVGGQIRVRGALQAGWTHIRAHILELDPTEEIAEAFCDNRHPTRVWVTEYEEIWEKLKKYPTLTARKVAEVNQMDPLEVEALLDALDLLSPKARKRVKESILSVEEDFIELHMAPIGKYEAIELAGLTGLCHDVELTRRLVERAIEVSLKEGMQACHLEGLVEWIKQGFYPEDYGKADDGKPLRSWKGLDSREPEWVVPADDGVLTVAPTVIKGEAARISGEATGESGSTGLTASGMSPGNIPEQVEEIPTQNIRGLPYDQRVIQEGGLKSYVQFIHRCLRLKGLGTSPKTSYEWGARSAMAWMDLTQSHRFPLFEHKPGRIEEPVYVFYVTKVGGKPLRWIAAAEVEDILRGCHIQHEFAWKMDYTGYVQQGILDRLDNPEGVWAGGSCGFVKVVREQ